MEKEEKEQTSASEAKEAKPVVHSHEGSKKGGRHQGSKNNTQHFPVEKVYEERLIKIRRVSKTTKGGRILRFSALAVVGDGKGKYGFGIAKSRETSDAIKKALNSAKGSMLRLPIVKNGTIPHEVVGKFGATSVFLKPAPAGTGVIAGGPVRAVLELGGIKNIYSKVYGSRNPINIIKATVNGLNSLKSYTALNKLKNSKEA